MKKFVFLLTFFLLVKINAQERSIYFTKYDKNRLYAMDDRLKNYSFDNTQLNEDLNKLLRYNNKRRTNGFFAYFFAVNGVITSVAALVAKNQDDSIASGFFSTIGIYTGLFSTVASVPFFIWKGKNKKRMKEQLLYIEKNYKLE